MGPVAAGRPDPAVMARLRSEIRISAYLRRCQAGGAFATVLRRGDADAGVVVIRSYQPGGPVRLFIETRQADGSPAWRRLGGAVLDEAEADRLVAREASFDSDLWVVEVEDREGRLFLDDPVLDD